MVAAKDSKHAFWIALCVLLTANQVQNLAAAATAGTADAASADPTDAGKLPWNTENVGKAVSNFMATLSDPYNMQGLWSVRPEQLQQLGLSGDYVRAAQAARSKFRQGLLNGSSAVLGGVGVGDGSLLGAALNSSNIPVRMAMDGKTVEMPILQNIVLYLSQQVEKSMKAAAANDSSLLAKLVKDMPAAGRKLLGADDMLQSLDEAAPSTAHQDPELVLHQALTNIERISRYMKDLADVAQTVFDAEDALKKASDDEASSEGSDSAEGSDIAGNGSEQQGDARDSHRRKLLQNFGLLLDPVNGPFQLNGYGSAIRLIFTNVFDLFRANGLYALVPLIADLRAIQTRYGWISDLLNILDAPFENLVNANYFALPQNNDDFIALVRKFAADYCTYEKATSSQDVIGAFTGPSLTYELAPVSCPIYADEVTGRNYISFADCDPAELTITVEPLTITEAYYSAATYQSTECKYTERFGTDLEFTVGDGAQVFTFRRSAQGVDIVPTVINWNADAKFHPVPLAEPNADVGASVTLIANATEAPGVGIFEVNAIGDLGTSPSPSTTPVIGH